MLAFVLPSGITCVIPELQDHVCVLVSSDPGDILFLQPGASCVLETDHKPAA